MKKNRKDKKTKADVLRDEGVLNPHPEVVVDPLFQEGEFFDPRDLIQVKYEMLRRVRKDGDTVTRAASDYGLTRPTFYEAQTAFDQKGLAGMIPKKRGPRGPHKLNEEILEFLRAKVIPGVPIRAPALAREIEAHFGIIVHPRTIERALLRREKKPR